MKSIKEANITNGTRVFVAADLDVPVENGFIGEKYRLDCLTPTLKYIIDKGGIPIIAGHLANPKGKFDPKLSTKQLVPYFDKELGQGKYELLENVRFDPREEESNDEYAKELASKADIYVNEVFSTCHRKNTSIVGVPKFLPKYAGLRLTQEIEHLGKALLNPQKPLVIVIGGAKLESKKPLVTRFLPIADYVLAGGKIGVTWDESVPSNLILPSDFVGDYKDMGPKTIEQFTKIIATAKTILWAGPVGVYEEGYITASKAIAEACVVATKENGAISIVGGGDTATVIDKLGLLEKFSFVSTGGGAMLEFLVKGTLPGIEALN